ncbi:MAG: hypothetical protein E7667_05525 [Ruminococcaceae bacterium]|nr:hypothetical protein [Oscillospiraceae bacterium]
MSNKKKNIKKNNNLKNKKTSGKKPSAKIIIIAIACFAVAAAVLIVGGIHLYKHFKKPDELPKTPTSPAMDAEQEFSDGGDVFDESYYEITQKTEGNIESLILEVKNRDEQMGAYQVVKRNKGSDVFFEVNYWKENGKGIYEYNFAGLDTGIDLSGIYYRTRIDDVDTIIDYYNPTDRIGEFITNGEFFNKYFGALSGITLDNMLSEIMNSGFVDFGKNANGDTVITSGDISICISDNENCDTRIIDKRADKICGYYISYGKHYSMPIIEHHEKND